ncbi:unnamed protein product [Caenorhabditis bovis]|uniref:Uncharacterized protein n=1 Tax=Caenorhabditis bovis TaxID=2654633 RepID=A0A8S1EH74_9PELO|nr:unnamed protein product [Caenorhabditis bovis]
MDEAFDMEQEDDQFRVNERSSSGSRHSSISTSGESGGRNADLIDIEEVAPEEMEQDDLEGEDDEETSEDGDQWTWDIRSSSTEEEIADPDPWYPMEKRTENPPNLFFLHKTPESFRLKRNDEEKEEEPEQTNPDNDCSYMEYKKLLAPHPENLELVKATIEYFTYYGFVDVCHKQLKPCVVITLSRCPKTILN